MSDVTATNLVAASLAFNEFFKFTYIFFQLDCKKVPPGML
jgi:hypothetical protein